MARLSEIIHTKFITIVEADTEAPVEDTSTTDGTASTDTSTTDGTASTDTSSTADGTASDDSTPVEGTETTDDSTTEDDTDTTDSTNTDDNSPTTVEDPEEDFDDADKNMEKMVGMVDIAHTSSSTTIDFEDGGQLMYVQPMISLQSSTLTEIMNLIISDVKKAYATSKDEITGKDLKNTKYWDSVKALIGTMVRSQLTKSDNMDGLVDEIKQVFKILEVK